MLFCLLFLWFFSPFFPFWGVREQDREVSENTETTKTTRSWENSLEEGGKRRISNKREELAICQKFAYSLCLSAEQWAGFGVSAKPFTLPYWAHKLFGLEAAVPVNSKYRNHLLGRDWAGTEGWDIWLPPSATTAMSSRAQGARAKSILVMAGFISLLQGTGFIHQDFFPYSTAVFPQRCRQSQRTRFPSFILWRL